MSGCLKDRVALVTGASRGIGRAVALAFAREGAHVIALARTQGALSELDDDIRALKSQATLVPLDLRDFDGIDRLGAAVHERWGRLDVLVGNAAVLGTLTPVPHIEPKEWDDVLSVNLTANWRLIRAFDPCLRASDAGRAIFVTSGVAHAAHAFWSIYAISKAALENMVATYALEMENTNVRANILNPGATRTAMRAQAMPGEDPATLPPAEEVAELFVEMARPEFQENGVMKTYGKRKVVSK